MNARVLLLVAGAAAAPAAAQSLADRVARAPDGTVRFAFAARPGVYGDGVDVITWDCAGGRCNHRRESNWSENDRDYLPSPCDSGPVRVTLSVTGGKVHRVRVAVGGRLRQSAATDLGAIGDREAVAYLLDLARQDDEDVSGQAVFAATLADSVTPWPDLLRLAKDSRVPTRARRQAIFWLGQAAGDAVTKDLQDIATADDQDREVRESAVFALSQQPDGSGVPALIVIARANKDPEVRRKAMFWLGQSNDPRALALFEEILSQP